jgi:Fe2+ or Zn2+ uptake regulation protein
MNAYDQFNRKHRRLSILRILEGAPGYASNEAILHQMVNHFGITSTRDQVRSELAWLAEVGLVKIEDLGSLMMATITERGMDIAQGHAHHPDIARRGAPKA